MSGDLMQTTTAFPEWAVMFVGKGYRWRVCFNLKWP
jgi:hypothetical protein